MRDLIEALDLFNQFESSAAHSGAIVAFKLAALLSLLADNTSLNDDDNVVK